MENSNLKEVSYVPKKFENITRLEADHKHIKRDTLSLQFAVIAGVLLQLECSAFGVWTSPAIIKMKSNDTNSNPLGREITTMEITELFSIPGYLGLIGGGVLPKLADMIGRKKCLHMFAFGLLFSAIGLAFSNHMYLMVVFYTIFQIISTGIWGILPVYITEICEDHNRVKYGCLMSLCAPLGQLFGYAVGLTFDFKSLTIVLAAPSIPSIVFLFFIPETPVFLSLKQRKQECITALRILRSHKTEDEIEDDYNNINQSILKEEKKDETKSFNIVTLFRKKEGRIGIFLAGLPLLAQYFSGVPALMPLLAPIFSESGSKLSGNTIALIVGIVQVLTFAITSLVIEKTGTKPMLIISSIGAGLMVSITGISFYLKASNSPIVNQFHWVPVAGIVMYIFFYSLGLGPIPMATMGEMFSPELRSTALSLFSVATGLVLAAYTSIFPLLAESIGTCSCLWIFGFSCFIHVIFFISMLPETKGKSDVEIQKMLRDYKFFE